MLDVFLTVDVEIWCDGWDDIDQKFPGAFESYIYGRTNNGDYGLPFQLDLLNQYNLKAVFFIEPLFAARFGIEPLKEIVEIIKSNGHEIQLHMHPEWVDEAKEDIIQNSKIKRQHMKLYSLNEQKVLIKKGLDLLSLAGVTHINAFRAGGFGANNDTLKALKENGIEIDCSYNETMVGGNCGINTTKKYYQPFVIEGLLEYPMSCYMDYPGHMRHMQIGACSFKEFKYLLEDAENKQYKSIVILSHSFELLSRNRLKGDDNLISRFRSLCIYLSDNRDRFNVIGFNNIQAKLNKVDVKSLRSPLLTTAFRMLEQYKINRFNKQLKNNTKGIASA